MGILFASQAPALGQSFELRNGATVEMKNGGVLDLEGQTMDFGSAGSTARLDEQSGGRVTGGLLTAVRALDEPSSADPAGLGLQVTASADLGEVTITRGHTVQTAQNGNESIERYYDVSSSQSNSGLSAELTLSYNESELGGRTESELEFFKSEDGGSSWSEEGADSRDAAANTVTLGGIESLSRWTLGSEDSPLPVELAGFGGTVTTDGVRLSWETTSETNNAGFEVQRRVEDARALGASRYAGGPKDGSWKKVGFVGSKTDGTTTEAQSYAYTDTELPYRADAPQYRLRQMDTDGSQTLTDPVTVEQPVERVELRETFPNPARQQVTVRFAVPSQQSVALQLYDLLGRQVQTSVQGEAEGRQERQMDVSELPTGTYFLRLVAEGETRTQKLTVVR
jgi:hypothetical protein